MPTVNVPNLIYRIQQIAADAVEEVTTTCAIANFLDTSPHLPCVTVRLDNVDYSDYSETRASEEVRSDVYTFIVRVVVAPRTADYDGRGETRLYQIMNAVRERFSANEWLTPTDADDPPDNLRHALLTSSTGLRLFAQTGTDAELVGVEFTLACTFDYYED